MTLGFSSEEEGLVLQVAFHAESHQGITTGETWTITEFEWRNVDE